MQAGSSGYSRTSRLGSPIYTSILIAGCNIRQRLRWERLGISEGPSPDTSMHLV